MIYAETERLLLRDLEQEELSHLVELLSEWEVVRWLSVVPFPYTMRDAVDFYADVNEAAATGKPEFFALSMKNNPAFIGGIGLHTPRTDHSLPGEYEIGYWLAHGYCGQGIMSEAVRAAIDIAFRRPELALLSATTEPDNKASQHVLMKMGFKNMGIGVRSYRILRGGDEVISWRLTRNDYEKKSSL